MPGILPGGKFGVGVKLKHLFSGLAVVALAGCSVSYDSRATDPTLYFGATDDPSDPSSVLGSNGLVYADGASEASDVEGQTMQVKLVRYVKDPTTGALSIEISDETATLVVGFADRTDQNMTLTLNGETLVFTDREATHSSGQIYKSYLNYALSHSGTAGVYSYESFNPILGDSTEEMEGFFTFGLQTDPAQIAGRDGLVEYSGSYYGYGQLADMDGNILDGELKTNGGILLEVDFTDDQVSGYMNGTFYKDGGNEAYNMFFLNADILGNGFVASPDMFCNPGTDCVSASSMAGVFYGNNGAEVSGVIGFDETIDPAGAAEATRFVGTAGFSAAED